MSDQLFTIDATPERLCITFDPPVYFSYWQEIKAVLLVEYKLLDANDAFLRLNSERDQISMVTISSWRPHGGVLQGSLLQKMERDIALILDDQTIDRTRLTDLEKMFGLKS